MAVPNDDIVSSNEIQELEDQNDDNNHNDGHFRATRDSHIANASIKGTNTVLNRPKTTLINLDDNANVRSTLVKENARNINFQDGGIYRSISQEISGAKMESKIPILFPRGSNIKLSDQASSISNNLDQLNGKTRKKTAYNSEGRTNLLKLRDSAYGLETMYQRRKQGTTTTTTIPISTAISFGSQASNQTFDSHRSYRPLSCTINSNHSNESQRNVLGAQNSSIPKVISHNHAQTSDERYSKSSDGYLRYSKTNFERRGAIEKIETVEQQTLPAFETSNYQRQRQFPSNPSFRAFKATHNIHNTRVYQDFPNSSHRTLINHHPSVQSRIDRRTTNDETMQKRNEIEEETSSGGRTNDRAFVNSTFRRRIRSLSPSGQYQPEKLMGVAFREIQVTSMFDIDKAAVNQEESSERTNNYYLPEANVYPVQALKNEDSLHEEHERIKNRSPGNTSLNVSANNSNIRRERSILKHQRDEDSDSNGNGDQRENNQKAFDVISRKSEERDTIDSYVLPSKESESSASVESTSTSDETSKDWSSEDGIKTRNEVVVFTEQDERLRDDEVTNANTESSDGTDDVDKNLETRRGSIVSVISSEKIINEVLASSNESLKTNYKNLSKSYQDVSTVSPSKHSGSPIRSELEFTNRAISANDSNLDLFGSPRRELRSPRLSASFDDHINEILGDANETDLISTTFHDESASFQSLEKEKLDKLNNILDSPRDSVDKISEYGGNIASIEDNVESRINEDINVSIENINVYDATEERTRDVAFTKISTPLESFTKLDDIRNDLESVEAPAILKIEPQAIENIEQPIKRILSKVPRSTTRSRTVSHNKTSQYSERTVDKHKPIVQQCFNQLENKDWEVTMKGLKSLSQLAKQHPEYLDSNIGGTIGRLLGRHIRSLRSQVARAACIAASDIFTSQIRGIDQDIDDIAGPLLHRTADTNRFLRADSNAALDRMIESLPPHKTIGIIVNRGANHQNAIVRGATARLLSSIVDRIGAEHTMILPRDVRDKLIGSGAKLLMDGNLDARNHAKKMFRRLAHCEGFRKALTDAVPETTLRHIDKTLKSL